MQIMQIIKRYVDLCGNNTKYSLLGLLCGGIGSYYNVIANEHMTRMMVGDFTNERLYLLFYTNFISMIAISLRGGMDLKKSSILPNKSKRC